MSAVENFNNLSARSADRMQLFNELMADFDAYDNLTWVSDNTLTSNEDRLYGYIMDNGRTVSINASSTL